MFCSNNSQKLTFRDWLGLSLSVKSKTVKRITERSRRKYRSSLKDTACGRRSVVLLSLWQWLETPLYRSWICDSGLSVCRNSRLGCYSRRHQWNAFKTCITQRKSTDAVQSDRYIIHFTGADRRSVADRKINRTSWWVIGSPTCTWTARPVLDGHLADRRRTRRKLRQS